MYIYVYVHTEREIYISLSFGFPTASCAYNPNKKRMLGYYLDVVSLTWFRCTVVYMEICVYIYICRCPYREIYNLVLALTNPTASWAYDPKKELWVSPPLACICCTSRVY